MACANRTAQSPLSMPPRGLFPLLLCGFPLSCLLRGAVGGVDCEFTSLGKENTLLGERMEQNGGVSPALETFPEPLLDISWYLGSLTGPGTLRNRR